MKTTFENDLEEIECEGLELLDIGREAAKTAQMRNEIYDDLLDRKKADLNPKSPN